MKKIRYFFCRKEKCLARHALNLEKKNYIGFYYSKIDAAAMKKKHCRKNIQRIVKSKRFHAISNL